MKILVTGASGQVGSRLVGQLLAKNYEVRGTALPRDHNLNRISNLSVEILEGDLLDASFCEKALEGVEGVIHTANLVGALPGMSETDFFNNNVITTFNMVTS